MGWPSFPWEGGHHQVNGIKYGMCSETNFISIKRKHTNIPRDIAILRIYVTGHTGVVYPQAAIALHREQSGTRRSNYLTRRKLEERDEYGMDADVEPWRPASSAGCWNRGVT
jgi:hypothetical protein